MRRTREPLFPEIHTPRPLPPSTTSPTSVFSRSLNATTIPSIHPSSANPRTPLNAHLVLEMDCLLPGDSELQKVEARTLDRSKLRFIPLTQQEEFKKVFDMDGKRLTTWCASSGSIPLHTKYQLEQWIHCVEEEVQSNRSIIIACQNILHRAENVCTEAKLCHPNVLSNAMAFCILTLLQPHLHSYEELVRGLVDEIGQSIFLTPPHTLGVVWNSAEPFSSKTFFDQFRRSLQNFRNHFYSAELYHEMERKGERVLDRAVDIWLTTLGRKMLLKWRGFARHRTNLRRKYCSLFSKVNGKTIVRRGLLVWREHARSCQLHALQKTNERIHERLLLALQVQRTGQEKLKDLKSAQAKLEKQLRDATGVLTKTREALMEAKRGVEGALKTHGKLRQAWNSSCMTLFGDAHHVPAPEHFLAWIEEKVPGMLFENPADVRKKARKGRITPDALVTLICRLAPWVYFQRMKGLAEEHTMTPFTPVAEGADLNEKGELVCSLFRSLTGLPSPIRSADIVSGDQVKMFSFIQLLMDMYSGGYCSLFFPLGGKRLGSRSYYGSHNRRRSSAFPTSSENNESGGSPTSSPLKSVHALLSHDQQEDVSDSVYYEPSLSLSTDPLTIQTSELLMMMDDWEKGKRVLAHCPTMVAATAASFEEAIQSAPTVQGNKEVQKLFEQLALVGGAFNISTAVLLPKQVILSALEKFFKNKRSDIMVSVKLYPERGIQSTEELIKYTTELAEVVGASSFHSIVLGIQDCLEMSPIMRLSLEVADSECQSVFKLHRTEFRRLLKLYSNDFGEQRKGAAGQDERRRSSSVRRRQGRGKRHHSSSSGMFSSRKSESPIVDEPLDLVQSPTAETQLEMVASLGTAFEPEPNLPPLKDHHRFTQAVSLAFGVPSLTEEASGFIYNEIRSYAEAAMSNGPKLDGSDAATAANLMAERIFQFVLSTLSHFIDPNPYQGLGVKLKILLLKRSNDRVEREWNRLNEESGGENPMNGVGLEQSEPTTTAVGS